MNRDFWCLCDLDDTQLLESTRRTVAQGRELTAQLVAHLAEVEERRLHLHAACSSLFDYCVNRLGLSEDEACRRIDAARLARRFPAIYPLLADGGLSLGAVAALKQYLTDDNHRELLQASRGLSLTMLRQQLAARFPREDVPSTVRKLPLPRPAPAVSATSTPPAQPVPAPPLPVGEAIPPALTLTTPAATRPSTPAAITPAARTPMRGIEPLASERYRIQLTAGPELKRKLEQCRDLMRHTNPGGDFAPIIERALELLLDKLMRERFGEAQRPRAATKRSASPHVTQATRRAVVARDGLRCTWVSEDGQRCDATAWLELDHVEPLAKGGSSEPSNVRVLCRNHNQLAAEVAFGRRLLDERVEQRLRRV